MTAQLTCCFQPFFNDGFGGLNRLYIADTIGHASRQFWHFNDEALISVAPVDNKFISAWHSLPRKLVLYDQVTDLFYLIGFCFVTQWLQIDDFGHAVLAKNEVISFDSFVKLKHG